MTKGGRREKGGEGMVKWGWRGKGGEGAYLGGVGQVVEGPTSLPEELEARNLLLTPTGPSY